MVERLQPVLRPKPEFSVPLAILGEAARKVESSLSITRHEKQELIAAKNMDWGKLIKSTVEANRLENIRISLLFKQLLLLTDVEATRAKLKDY